MAARAYDCLQSDFGANSNQHVGSTTPCSAAPMNGPRGSSMARYSTTKFCPSRRPFFSSCEENAHRTPSAPVCGRAEESYSVNFFSLLCARAKRPRQRRAAGDKTNEFPTPHVFGPEGQTRNGSNPVARGESWPAMSALGQKQTCAAQKVMSALPPKADVCSATGMSAKCQKRTLVG